MNDELDAALDFLSAAGALKDTLRSARTSEGRPEDAAAHSWRLALWAFVLADEIPELDYGRLLTICLIHDLGEAITGDVPAVRQAATPERKQDERRAMRSLAAKLPRSRGSELLSLYEEYLSGGSAEARFARGLDKLETMLQHVDGRNPDDFDYAFNLGYGRGYTAAHPLLVALRARLDAATRRRRDARA